MPIIQCPKCDLFVVNSLHKCFEYTINFENKPFKIFGIYPEHAAERFCKGLAQDEVNLSIDNKNYLVTREYTYAATEIGQLVHDRSTK
jgi:hypothetical protein